ncbi:hypothetical protein BJI55_00480 [Acinetobacter pittii]|nr:hypothetical protein BJI55_00480 [Acinetobacter pittii]
MVILISKILKWHEADKVCTEFSAGLTISQILIRKKYLNEIQKIENKKGDSLGWKPKNLQKAKN